METRKFLRDKEFFNLFGFDINSYFKDNDKVFPKGDFDKAFKILSDRLKNGDVMRTTQIEEIIKPLDLKVSLPGFIAALRGLNIIKKNNSKVYEFVPKKVSKGLKYFIIAYNDYRQKILNFNVKPNPSESYFKEVVQNRFLKRKIKYFEAFDEYGNQIVIFGEGVDVISHCDYMSARKAIQNAILSKEEENAKSGELPFPDISDFENGLNLGLVKNNDKFWKEAEEWANKKNEENNTNSNWRWDCGFKLDYDGDYLSISSRFYPPHKSHPDYGKYHGSVSLLLKGKEISRKEFEENTLEELSNEVEEYVKELEEKITKSLYSLSF